MKTQSRLSITSGSTLCAALLFVVNGCGAAATTAAPVGAPAAESVTPAAISGTWVSEKCESTRPMSSEFRTFTFTDKVWKLDLDAFGGLACDPAAKMFTIEYVGEYTVGAKSQVVSGAHEGTFSFAKTKITPTAAGVGFLKQQCGQYDWAAGTAIEVGQAGCGMVAASNVACPVEYDLVGFVGNSLYSGDRSQPLCSPDARPKKLYPFGLVKK